MNTTYFVDQDFDLKDLANALESFFKEKNMQAQIVEISTNEIAVQAKNKDSYLRKLASLDKACTVSMKFDKTKLNVEIGQGKWIDKAAGAAIAWFIFAPVIITTAYGAYQQFQLPKQVNEFIQIYLGVEPVNFDTSDTESSFCPNCGEKLNGNEVFCSKCGQKL